MNVAAGDTLTLDGQGQHDEYLVITTGTQGPERNYVINVLDTGVNDSDNLSIWGADDSDDIFLLRRILAIANETSENPAFVDLFHASLASLRLPNGNASSFNQQRVNYDNGANGRGIDGLLSLFGLSGNDTIATDDTSSVTRIDGGAGSDTFQIGQLFGLPRDGTTISPVSDTFRQRTGPAGHLPRDPQLAEPRQQPAADRGRRRRRRRLHRLQQPGHR